MKTRENPLVFRAKRFVGFLRILVRVKKGILGLLLIIGFGTIAFAAPVLTSYSPLGRDLETRQPVAQKFCVPSWFRLLPPQLVGNRKFSENFIAVDDPGFPRLVEDGGEWLFMTEGRGVSVHPESDVDYPNLVPIKNYVKKNGSMAITFSRERGIAFTESKAYLFKKFDYPYEGPPVAFSGNVELLANGTTHSIGTVEYLDVPVKVRGFMGSDGGKNWTLWPPLASKVSIDAGSLNALVGFSYYRYENITAVPVIDGRIMFEPGSRWLQTEGPEKYSIWKLTDWKDNGNGYIDQCDYLNFTQTIPLPPAGQPPKWDYRHVFIAERVDLVTTKKVYITGEVMISQPMNGRPENAQWIISRASYATANSYIDEEDLSRLAMGLNFDQDPIPLIFTKMPGKYVYGIELTFLDTDYPKKAVESIVYIDDLYVETYGSCFGLMGTDHEGADLFAQLVYGTRLSLYLGIAVSIMTVVLGLSVGLAAGYFGRFVDEFLMRFNDFMLCLPTLPLLIVLAAVLGTTLENLMIIMILLGWNGFARVIRSQALSLKERPFIEAAKAAGAGSGHVVLRHILPNVMALVYVSLATSVPGAVTAEASLSWLGFFDPSRMSWGRMLYNISNLGGTAQVAVNPVWVLVPGLSISLLAVAFILLGYALDDVLNPQLRVRR